MKFDFTFDVIKNVEAAILAESEAGEYGPNSLAYATGALVIGFKQGLVTNAKEAGDFINAALAECVERAERSKK